MSNKRLCAARDDMVATQDDEAAWLQDQIENLGIDGLFSSSELLHDFIESLMPESNGSSSSVNVEKESGQGTAPPPQVRIQRPTVLCLSLACSGAPFLPAPHLVSTGC